MQSGIHTHTQTNLYTKEGNYTHIHTEIHTCPERDTQTDREIQRYTLRKTHRKRHTKRCTHTYTDTYRHTKRHTQVYIPTYRDTHIQRHIHAHFLTTFISSAPGEKSHFPAGLYQYESWRTSQPLTSFLKEQASLCELSEKSTLDGRLRLLAELACGDLYSSHPLINQSFITSFVLRYSQRLLCLL